MKIKRFKLAILFLIFCCVCNGNFVAAQKKSPDKWLKGKSHVLPGGHTEKLIASINIPTSPMEATKYLVAILHDRKLFKHINKKHFLDFAKPSYSLKKAQAKLKKKLKVLEKKENRTEEEEQEMRKLRNSIEVLKYEYRAYKSRYSKFNRRDWPFCLSGDEYIWLRITDGCTSFSKMFMTIANKIGLYQDMRLLDSACYDDLKNNEHLLGTDGSELNQTIDGHKMVLAKWQGKWWLINVTHYRRNSDDPSQVEYEILDQLNSNPISPEALLYQSVRMPSLANSPSHHHLVVAAIGKDRRDDLNARSWKQNIGLSLSIPRDIFEAIH